MGADKKVRTSNEYVGMSIEQLNHQEDICKMMIRQSKSDIQEKQKEIAELERVIKNYTNSLHRIETAKTKVGNIEYTAILVVHVETKEVRKDTSVPFSQYGYYSPSDYKSFLVYNFEVIKVNKKDFNKAGEVLYSTVNDVNVPTVKTYSSSTEKGFKADNKKELQKFILNAIKAFGVTDVFFNEGVSIGKSEIEKLIGKPVKVKGKYDKY